MATANTAEKVLNAIRLLGGFGDTNSPGFTDEDLLVHCNDVIDLLYAEAHNLQEDYFIKREEYDLSELTRGRVDMPNRAFLGQLQNVWHLHDSNDRERRTWLRKSNKSRLEALETLSSATRPIEYYIDGDEIVLVPELATFEGILEISYPIRANDLVLSTECRAVVDVDLETQSVALAPDKNGTESVPSNWTTTKLYDVHSSQGTADLRVWDYGVTTIGGDANNQLVFSLPIDGSIPGTRPVKVGDYVCLAETCAIPMIPRDLISQFVRNVVLRVSESTGAEQQARLHAANLSRQEKANAIAMEDRVDYQPLTVSLEGGFLAAADYDRYWRR